MKVTVIGAGLIGRRRAGVAVACGDRVAAVYDADRTRGETLAGDVGARAVSSSEEAVGMADIVVVSTPNKSLLPMARLAMEAGKHCLIEKPMGRNVEEARALADLRKASPELVLKVGFNHRYHSAVATARDKVVSGEIGDPLFIRAVYGHGGRPGYEKEWRGNRDLAGGGELTDQGVHLIDLVCWFMGPPEWVFAQRRTYVWPLSDLEDNGFMLLGWADGRLAQLHTSWTQWKNRFSFQVFGTAGSAEIEGLGGSYGEEILVLSRRNSAGGVPAVEKTAFPGEDISWTKEWKDFRGAIDSRSMPMGSAQEGLQAMQVLDAVYRSCSSGEKELT